LQQHAGGAAGSRCQRREGCWGARK
jgi:hypothetical protein